MQVRLLCATAVDKESNACSVGGGCLGTGSPRKLGMMHCSFTDNSCGIGCKISQDTEKSDKGRSLAGESASEKAGCAAGV